MQYVAEISLKFFSELRFSVSERGIILRMNTETEAISKSIGNETRQRFVYGLALAYRLFNVVELIESVVRGHSKQWHENTKSAKDTGAVRFDTTPSAERSYIARVATLKRLNAEEELALARQMQSGDELARNLLVSANLGLVVMFARKYSRTGAPVIDLVAEGNIALLKATRTFDPERGFRFATYAKRPVTQAMVRALPRLTGAMTVPLPVQATAMSAEQTGTAGAGRQTPGDDSVSAKTGHDAWVNLGPVPDAADIPEDEKHEPANRVGDFLRDQTLKRALECLKEREREIVSARFGLDEIEPETLASLAQRFEISIERVRQIETAGLKRLAHHFDQAGHSLGTML